MSHFAKVLNGKVLNVIVADQEFIDTFVDSVPGPWIQTSYNTYRGVHLDPVTRQPDNGTPLRGNFAVIGGNYDSTHDVFYGPKPYPSWTLDQTHWDWVPPVDYPEDAPEKNYRWDETSQTWIDEGSKG